MLGLVARGARGTQTHRTESVGHIVSRRRQSKVMRLWHSTFWTRCGGMYKGVIDIVEFGFWRSPGERHERRPAGFWDYDERGVEWNTKLRERRGFYTPAEGERATRTETIKNSQAFILRRKETRIIQKPLELCQDARRRGEQS
jgi:hypothetical protein